MPFLPVSLLPQLNRYSYHHRGFSQILYIIPDHLLETFEDFLYVFFVFWNLQDNTLSHGEGLHHHYKSH